MWVPASRPNKKSESHRLTPLFSPISATSIGFGVRLLTTRARICARKSPVSERAWVFGKHFGAGEKYLNYFETLVSRFLRRSRRQRTPEASNPPNL